MTKQACAAALGLALALAVGPGGVSPEPAVAGPPAKADAGVALFDGKSLTGWKSANYPDAGKVAVRDGAIFLGKGSPMTAAVYTKGGLPRRDYELSLEAKKLDGGDFFATTTFPVGDAYCSLVVGGWGGGVVGLSSLNSLDASENETSTQKEFQRDRWYRIRIRVTGDRIVAWIDDDKLVDVGTEGKRVGIRLECAACKPFGFCTWNTVGAVRHVRVRALTEAEKKAPGGTKPGDKD